MDKKHIKRRSRSRGIAETYIYIKEVPRDLSPSKVRRYLEKHARIWAEQKFKSSVTVQITVEEGSLKIKVLVGALTIFNLVAGYGSFRGGIDHIVKDSRSFSEQVIERFSADENLVHGAIERAERRLGVPGKIQRFFKSIDRLNSLDLSHNEREERIDDLRDEFISIIELLESEEDRARFTEEVPNNIKPEPDRPLPPPIRGAVSLAYNREDE